MGEWSSRRYSSSGNVREVGGSIDARWSPDGVRTSIGIMWGRTTSLVRIRQAVATGKMNRSGSISVGFTASAVVNEK